MGTNMYAYCNGNPVMYVDRNGREPIFGFVMDFLDLFDLTWVGPIVVAFYDFFTNLDLSPLLVFLQIGGRFWNGLVGLIQSFDFGGLLSGIWKLVVGVIVWFVKIIASIIERFTGGQEYSLEQERNDTLALQAKCFALIDPISGDYSKVKWDLITTEGEKRAFLNGLFQRTQTVMKTSIDNSVSWETLGSDEETSPRGMYAHRSDDPSRPIKNKMTLNLDFLTLPNSYNLVYTIFHEVRHAFQQEAILGLNGHIVCKGTINAWARNLPSYAKGSIPGSPGYNVGSEYITQAIEWDAKCFAKQYIDLTYEVIVWSSSPPYVPISIERFPIILDENLPRSYAGIWGTQPIPADFPLN